MDILLILSLFFAILSPILFGAMNIVDRFATSKKVKNPFGFAVVIGMTEIAIGALVLAFVGLDNIAFKDLLVPALCGILGGANLFFYYALMKKDEVSSVIGMMYIYPVFVAIFAYIFLKELLNPLGYIGAVLTIIGVIALSIKTGKLNMKAGIWMLASIIIITAINEVLIKVASSNMPGITGASIQIMFTGVMSLFGLMSPKIRRSFVIELKNLKWAALSEGLFLISLITIYIAMSRLPATFVSAVAAIQPLAVLVMERFISKHVGIISRKDTFRKKIIPIMLIVIGIAILYAAELLLK